MAYGMIILLVLLSGPAPALAQDTEAPINPAIGDWDLTMTLNGDEHDSNLIVSEINGELKGIWSSRLGTLDLDNITYDDGTLTFKHSLNVAGETYTFHFEGKIDHGDITGHFLSGADRAPVTGKKKQQPEIVGVWKVTTTEAGETKTYTLTITPNMLGTYTGDELEYAVTNVEQSDHRVTFDISSAPTRAEPEEDEDETAEATDEVPHREFEGALTNDVIEGVIYSDGQPVAELTAKREGSPVARDEFVEFVGAWELFVESQIGDFQNEMVINNGGSGIYVSDEESELRNLRIEDGWLMFITTVHVQGAEYDVEFEGKLNEEGLLLGDFYLDGSAVARVEGTRGDDD